MTFFYFGKERQIFLAILKKIYLVHQTPFTPSVSFQ